MAHPVVTRTVDQVDLHHGELVADPYRWLEDTGSSETAHWVAAQNEFTQAWLATVPTREAVRSRLAELWDYPRYGVPFQRGGLWFQDRNSGLQDQPVLYVMSSPEVEGRVLLDPRQFSADGTVAVTAMAVTDDGSLLAYATSSAGSDWMTWHVREVATGLDRDDLVEWSKFSGAAWRKDCSGFYYAAPEPPQPGAELLGETGPARVFFHRLGTAQHDDEVVFEAPEKPEWCPDATVSEDGRFLVVSVQHGTGPETMLHVVDLGAPGRGPAPITADFSCKALVVGNVGTTFYLLTDHGAERQRLVAVELDRPGKDHWREVVPESQALLLEARLCGGVLVCHHLEHACSRLSVVKLDGEHVRDLPLPPIVSVSSALSGPGLEGRAGSRIVHFALSSFTDPGSLWSHDLSSGQTRLVRSSSAPLNSAALVSEQVFVTADDGAQVPLFLVHRRDVSANGDVPVLLYGYGGFDISLTPAFSRAQAVFMERGGLLAVAVLRGGGEYGRAWHNAGRLANKQRVFDDFADCARWLASSGWSRPGRIAINGASNGGLLVGACLTQHPELFGAAVPEVGVLDMLRFHRFTIGWAWKSDYGDPDDPEQYRWARAYSPLHNVRPGEHYPPTLVMTGDHDDRVVPGHSFKFAAALQAAQAGPAPVLIRVETSAGHGTGKPTAKAIAERADMLSFLEGALGLAPWGPEAS
jgi:prolyl oligopeptidase